MDGTKLLKFANKLEDENKDKCYKWLYDKLRYQIIKDQNQAINYIHCCTEFCFNCSSETKNEIDSKDIVRCDNCGIKR